MRKRNAGLAGRLGDMQDISVGFGGQRPRWPERDDFTFFTKTESRAAQPHRGFRIRERTIKSQFAPGIHSPTGDFDPVRGSNPFFGTKGSKALQSLWLKQGFSFCAFFVPVAELLALVGGVAPSSSSRLGSHTSERCHYGVAHLRVLFDFDVATYRIKVRMAAKPPHLRQVQPSSQQASYICRTKPMQIILLTFVAFHTARAMATVRVGLSGCLFSGGNQCRWGRSPLVQSVTRHD